TPTQDSARQEHPALGRRVHLAGSDSVVFEQTLPAAVIGRRLANDDALRSLLAAAAEAVMPSMDLEGFERIAAVPQDGTRIVQTVIEPQASGTWRCRIHSRHADDVDAQWMRHAEATAR